MKKYFFAFFLFLGFATLSNAQGDLQFNQVIILEVPAGGTTSFTVPADKVWKIESSGSETLTSSTYVWLRNASDEVIACIYRSGTISYGNYNSILPYWLPSSYNGSFYQNGNTARCSISIMEFNVIP